MLREQLYEFSKIVISDQVQQKLTYRSIEDGLRLKVFRVVKTEALISVTVTAKLICAFGFAYEKCWFSHESPQIDFLLYQSRNLP